MVPLTSLFFLWGFMTVLNDILIPFLKEHYELDYFRSMLVQTSFFGSYFLGSLIYFSLSTAWEDPINRIGYKNGIIVGLTLSGIGCMIFLPAGTLDSYGVFLFGLMVLGFGFTLLQIAANPFVSIAGPKESASSRLNLAQGFNSFGTMIGPLVGGAIIFNLLSGIEAISYPYFFAGLIFLGVAVLFFFLPIPSWKNEEKIEQGFGALNFLNLKWGILAIFFYVGAEVGIGSLLINLLGLPEYGSIPEKIASDYLSLYWGGLMIGRFGGAISQSGQLDGRILARLSGIMILSFLIVAIANMAKGEIGWAQIGMFFLIALVSFLAFVIGRGQNRRTLGLFALIIVLLLFIGSLGRGNISLWALIGIGLFNSIMWPNIFTSAIEGLGKYTSQGSSLLVMAILGGAVIPPIMGLLADQFGLRISLFVPIICYLYIIWYSSRPYWIKNKESGM